MGLFSSKKKAAEAEKWEKKAETYSKEAREEARKAAKHTELLRSGKSTDPAADRYMIREHDGNRRVAEANARDCRFNAETTRKWWT
ncbi:hypothetical protein OG884_15400 [Streptosporangium sp. NBC_01755]|uniref:hypothetical protein n=1 Tax=Streptosporangium sp. NBC_01755 TaxID=2975949 RepID=UPI002DD8D7F9|nr:hypothetical protein [Streptosporangium sp. NBC_01755]WSD03219.1 hypothetical protein OG884_15400 [Streptosporangium sp. NBC_01755]